MAQITNLNELVPEDIVFQYGNPPVEYVVPGDLDGETVFKLFRMFGSLAELMGANVDDAAKTSRHVNRLSREVDATLLALFQIRQPDLEKLPFGFKSMPIVIRTIMQHLGLGVADDPSPAPKRKPQTGRKRSQTKRSTSRRASSSGQ